MADSGRNSRDFRVLETEWIPLRDGCRLAARIWLPEGAEDAPVPAILEYLPYRRRDGTAPRDESTYPRFAAAGYAGVRVDIRGQGDSEGIFDDEYSPRELAEAVEVIDWIAAQPWCDGNVGMMGISWGGFNSLQVAALRPAPLKAVIGLSTTVDRYNDDIHYKGGCQLSANLGWSSTMFAYTSRPPDPEVVGAGWREAWLQRLAALTPPIFTWLAHQRRDAYWRHGSICEDYGALHAAAMVIGGWADGYKNAPPAAAAGLGAPAKAINGPWIHKYPHAAWPKPRMDFLTEALAWWDRWLKGARNGAEALPAYRAYITEGVRPGPWRERDPGRWIAQATWPPAQAETRRLHLATGGGLSEDPGEDGTATLCSPQDCGIVCGEYFSTKPDAELAGDQRIDDGGALVFETAPLTAPLEVLGRPRLKLRVAIDAPTGNLCARLIDVHPDGLGHRVSFAVLNLAHRRGNAEPQPMTPGRAEEIELVLDECGHRFRAGHRLRISLSTAYWPLILPPPTAVTARIETGAAAALELPLLRDAADIEMPEPADSESPPSYEMHRPAASRRWVERDLTAGRTLYHIHEDTGASEHPGHGMVSREVRRETWSIAPDDPAGAQGECHWTTWRSRGDWRTRTETRTRLTADAERFYIDAGIEAYEGDELVFQRELRETIARDLM